MYSAKAAEVHAEKRNHKQFLKLPGGRFNFYQDHPENVDRSDNQILDPVKQNDGRSIPAQKNNAEQGQQIGNRKGLYGK
ncbi:hypothetical protein GWN26_10640 [Candidatus Saccharibacteria bacterium]|nr:hypothetical protein [Candidatus Saccharibacteria bacterium]